MAFLHERAFAWILWGVLSACSGVAGESEPLGIAEETLASAMMMQPSVASSSSEGTDSRVPFEGPTLRFHVPIAQPDGSLLQVSDPRVSLKRPGAVVVACSEEERTTRVHFEIVGGGGALPSGHQLILRMHSPCSRLEDQLAINAENADILQVLEEEDDEKEPSPILDSNGSEWTFDAGTTLPIRLELRSNCLPAHANNAERPPPLPDAHVALLDQGVVQRLATRAPREVWFELEHRDAQGQLLERDVALCTLAPFTFRSELEAPERIHAILIPDARMGAREKRGNFGFLMELLRIAEEAGVSEASLGLTSATHTDP